MLEYLAMKQLRDWKNGCPSYIAHEIESKKFGVNWDDGFVDKETSFAMCLYQTHLSCVL